MDPSSSVKLATTPTPPASGLENLDLPPSSSSHTALPPLPPSTTSISSLPRSLPHSPSKRSSASASQVSLPPSQQSLAHASRGSVSTFGDVGVGGSGGGEDLFSEQRPAGEDGQDEDDDGEDAEEKTESVEKAEAERKASVDQLGILALSARMTEVDMMVQEVSLLLFEIQELRHTSQDVQKRDDVGVEDSAEPPGSVTSKGSTELALTPVDRALMKLNKRLETTSQEITALESSLSPYLSPTTPSPSTSPDLEFLREKWDDLFISWHRISHSSDNLREELKEDAWLTVFRSASKQAEEMMESLERVLGSAQEFVWEVGRRRKGKERERGKQGVGASGVGEFGEEEGEELMKAHQALVKSFDTKRKYYVPATERVLRMLDKGIEERRTKNGEVLRRSGAMKARFKSIRDRLVRTERDLTAVEGVLAPAAAPATMTPSTSVASSLGSSSQRTPSKGSPRSGDNSYLSPDSNPRASMVGGAKNSSPGAVSPFRRLVNKMTPGRPFSPSAHSSPDVSPQQQTTPSRPGLYARARLRTRESGSNLRAKSGTPVPSLPAGARSLSGGDVATVKGRSKGGRESVLRQSVAEDHRPPWNISLRKEEEAAAATVTPQKKRPPLVSDYVSPGSSVYSPSRSRHRPSSVFQMPPGQEQHRRATSPSVMSDDSGHTRAILSASYRPRQSVGGGASKIPTPSWLVSAAGGGPGSVGTSRPVTPSLTNMSYEHDQEVLEQDQPPTTLMQRAMSPAPSSVVSNSAKSVSTSPGGTSKIPIPSPGRARSVTPNHFLGSSVGGPSSRYSASFGPGYSPSARSSLSASTGGGGKRAFSPTASDIAMMPRWNSSAAARSHTPEPGVALKAQKVSSTYRNTPSRLGDRRPSSRMSLGASLGPASMSAAKRPGSQMQMRPSHTPLPDLDLNGSGTATPYEANSLDPLDIKVAQIVAAQPLVFSVHRVDPPLSRADVGSGVGDQARYIFSRPDRALLGESGGQEKPVMCKLTARVMPKTKERSERVLCRVKGGWIDLDLYLLEKQAQAAA